MPTPNLSASGIRLVMSLCFLLSMYYSNTIRSSGEVLAPSHRCDRLHSCGENDSMLGWLQSSKHLFHKRLAGTNDTYESSDLRDA